MALDLLPDNHPDVAPESLFLQITALREAEPAAAEWRRSSIARPGASWFETRGVPRSSP